MFLYATYSIMLAISILFFAKGKESNKILWVFNIGWWSSLLWVGLLNNLL